MSEEQPGLEVKELTRFQRHKFLLLVAGTIIISLVLVSVALMLYVKNGTEQLDLSRPGYQQVGREVTANGKSFDGFPSKGPLDASVAQDFLKLYKTESDNVTKANAYDGSPLSDKSLSIGQQDKTATKN